MPRNSFHATIYKFEVTILLRKIYHKPGLKLRPSEQTIHCTQEGEGTLGTRLCPTSFPGSSLFLPRGRKREDPENEVGHNLVPRLCLIAEWRHDSWHFQFYEWTLLFLTFQRISWHLWWEKENGECVFFYWEKTKYDLSFIKSIDCQLCTRCI